MFTLECKGYKCYTALFLLVSLTIVSALGTLKHESLSRPIPKKHQQLHLFECTDKIVSCSEEKKSQQIVFTMHSTANHNDMVTFVKTN